ncbi:BQ2448_2312 [Microbotryum intermedium]|uniref:BQ2448_2312 protein n=1 Tax=Microbotryum intermedium TaxID=269621 RepID=A0A238F5S4_9BASI|nr:BQ2448_2312 [Microbotryum intermedium]
MPEPPHKKAKRAPATRPEPIGPPSNAGIIASTSADALDNQFELERQFEHTETGSDDGLGSLASDNELDTRAQTTFLQRDEDGEATASVTATTNKRRRKAAHAVTNDREQQVHDSSQVWMISSAAAVERLLMAQRRALPTASAIELDELALQGSFILDAPTVARTSLLSYIREAMPTTPATLAKPIKKEGSPRILVIAGAALRVADLCRELKPFLRKDLHIAKLFAKHFKLTEHAQYLKEHKVSIAVGTPHRVSALLDNASLGIDQLSHLILDVTHLDKKQRGLLDTPEVSVDLFRSLLSNKSLLDRLQAGRMKIVCY